MALVWSAPEESTSHDGPFKKRWREAEVAVQWVAWAEFQQGIQSVLVDGPDDMRVCEDQASMGMLGRTP